MTQSAQIQVRIDPKIKAEAQKVLEASGLSLSTAIKMLFFQTVQLKRLPLEIRDENGFTLQQQKDLIESIQECEKSTKGYSSAEEMHEDILKN